MEGADVRAAAAPAAAVNDLVAALTAQIQQNLQQAGAARIQKPVKYSQGMNFGKWLRLFETYCDAMAIPEEQRRAQLLSNMDFATFQVVDNMNLNPNLAYESSPRRCMTASPCTAPSWIIVPS